MNDELDLLDLFFAFWKKKVWLILAIVVGGVAGFLYTKYAVTPKYASSVRIVLAKSAEESSTVVKDSSDMITSTDITLNQKLISTYSEIVKSKRTCNTVIQNLKLSMSYSELVGCINVSSVKDTEIILLKITTKDPELSAKIANEMTEVFKQTVNEIYSIKNIIVLDDAEVSRSPVNVSYSKNCIIFALVAFMFVAAIIFLIYYFDNTIKTEESIQKLTGLPVLASIPNVKDAKGGKKNA